MEGNLTYINCYGNRISRLQAADVLGTPTVIWKSNDTIVAIDDIYSEPYLLSGDGQSIGEDYIFISFDNKRSAILWVEKSIQVDNHSDEVELMDIPVLKKTSCLEPDGREAIVFELDGVRAVSRLIDGEFFDIGRVTRNDITTKVTVNRSELCKSLDRSLLLVRDNTKTPIIFDISGNIMNLSINSSVGKFDESTECVHEGSDMVVAFNPKLLLEALNAIDDDEVVMHMSGEKSPCYIKDDAGTYNYIVLPVNFVR